MENLERAQSRTYQAEQNARLFEPPHIQTVADIQRVLVQLEPNSRLNNRTDDTLLSTEMLGSDISRSQCRFAVSVKTKTHSYRDLLLEAFQGIKQRQDAAVKASAEAVAVPVNGKEMRPPPVVSDMILPVDDFISRLLSGRRRGLYIEWDLVDGYTYHYDVFEHRLTRSPRA